MTPEALRSLRESRGLTREQLATELNCSASAIVQWEGNKRTIPSWVEEKMLAGTTLNFPLTDLRDLLNLAVEEQIDFDTLLSETIKDIVAKRRAAREKSKLIHLKEHLKGDSTSSRAAEDPPHFG